VIFCPQEVLEDFLALTYADRQHLPRDATAPGSLRCENLLMAVKETLPGSPLLSPRLKPLPVKANHNAHDCTNRGSLQRVSFLACGYWLVHRSSRVACADDAACARPLANRFVKAGLIVATILVVAAIGVDLLAPLLLNS
jgi:hypothetical protein